MSARPRECHLADNRLAGLVWEREGLPVEAPTWVALHGWLDNAATFTRLVPLLVERLDIRIVAIDFAGHGKSQWQGRGTDYALWDYIHDVLDTLDDLGIERATLLAHSLGACVSCLLAAALPERIERLWLIDGIGALTTPVNQSTRQLRNGVLGVRRPLSPPPSYSSLEAALDARVAGAITPLDHDTAEPLMARSLVKDEARMRYRTDPRLLRPSQVKLTPEQSRDMLLAIRAPVDLIKADNGIVGDHLDREGVRHEMTTLTTHQVPGGHHLHLEPQSVAGVAEVILRAYGVA
ncbi:alpha/beta hydrolase [Kushneria marisflavi]|uniref:Alpha/beta hydrolase n=1 Tax=Kushneria marisflavi TaxID=157779 RepID=A0A240ULF5_9GAMM|nr:alpha/beta fold hydrolase [Kushneria marisflavi]ART61945.1 alpha/beta hydrolase [Kushneria marisflavi]RKD86992.1 epoxide hydrolase [Kushneria marisflavi]